MKRDYKITQPSSAKIGLMIPFVLLIVVGLSGMFFLGFKLHCENPIIVREAPNTFQTLEAFPFSYSCIFYRKVQDPDTALYFLTVLQ